ncbi:MBL fold metallo-hydrolase [Deinococcus marmoris]|uniref:Metallo-beta-lactamase superfamily protein n=1 Tax=Deinococcus marmoris TaxID=249408 RepID=A0A1U7NT97_9DEIO|nr:MBL fold metallo-hydrolase [Deinococcus marmoris]OLV16149.1 Metallo-beta-lactamase superfamily protein [Deinococcus marmoris]
MTDLTFTVLDLDFPVGSQNKTATLITGEQDALLIDAGFTRADGHRLVAAVLDSGKTLGTIFVSHADPDFYWGLEALADAFPSAEILATPLVAQHIAQAYEGKLKAWSTLGPNLPIRLVPITSWSGQTLGLEDHTFELRGGHALLPDRHYLWQPQQRAIVGGVLLFQNEHVWTADTATPEERTAWISLLDEMDALNPAFVVPGHRLPGLALDTQAIAYTRDYLRTYEDILKSASDGAAATQMLTERYPHSGMLIAAQIGPKVAKGEMKWG